MTQLRQQLMRHLTQLLIRRIREAHAATMAEAYLEDLGDDDCPVCLANRRRNALVDAWHRWERSPHRWDVVVPR